MYKPINLPNSVNEISIVCAQNDVQIAQEYLMISYEHHHLLNPENGEQNIVFCILLAQEEFDERGWKVNKRIVINLCHSFSKHGYQMIKVT